MTDTTTADQASRRWGQAASVETIEPPALSISQLLSAWQAANDRLQIARQRGLRAMRDPDHMDRLVTAEREARQRYLVAEEQRRIARHGPRE